MAAALNVGVGSKRAAPPKTLTTANRFSLAVMSKASTNLLSKYLSLRIGSKTLTTTCWFSLAVMSK